MLKFLTGKSHNVTSNFKYIDWGELVAKVKQPKDLGGVTPETAKTKSEIIAATDAIDKTKSSVLAHDNFTLLRLDLDETNLDIEGIEDALINIGVSSFIIHTTASHKQQGKGNRFRVYVELAESLNYETWAKLESYLSYLFMADDCATRPQQIMYLPVRFNGDCYAHCIVEGDPLSVENSNLLERADSFLQEQIESQKKASVEKPIKSAFKEKLVGSQVSIIDAVNQSYEWVSLLQSFGYKRQGRAYLPPESTSKAAGAYILTSNTDGMERYYSHHENDPCATGKCIDIFDFLVIRTFNGDVKLALSTLASNYFPKLDKHNKKEWAIAQKNKNVHGLFKGVAE